MPRGGERLRTAAGLLNSIGSRVLERRVSMGLTRDQLAARLTTETAGNPCGEWIASEDEIYKIQAGKRMVSELEVKALARVLGCSILWLMGEE